jgi:hypothetical protein
MPDPHDDRDEGDPTPPDLLAQAVADVVACQAELEEAHTQMMQAREALGLLQGSVVGNERLCVLDPDDPFALVAVQMATDASAAYREALSDWRQAQARLREYVPPDEK